MKLRVKSFLVISSTILVFLAFMYTVLRPYLLEAPIALDETNTRKDLQRINNQVQSDMKALARTTKDWAVWNDTYHFMQGTMPNYPESNLTNQTFENNLIHFILMFDEQHQLVFQTGYNFETQQEMELDPKLYQSFQTIIEKNSTVNQSMLVESPYGLTISALYEILDTNGNGPSEGILVMGRILNEGYIHQVEKTLSLDLDWIEGRRENQMLEEEVQILNDDYLLGSLYLQETVYKNAYEIVMKSKREFYKQRRESIRYLTLYLFIACLALIIIIHYLLQKFIVSRVDQLSVELMDIQKQKNTTLRVKVSEGLNDEITSLENSINHMLTALDKSHIEVRRLAYYDQLTALPNRYYLEEYFEQLKQKRTWLHLLFFDLDGFKQVNDCYGHKAGDRLLQIIASRVDHLAKAFGGVVTRFGGDEFIVLLTDQTSQEVHQLAEEIISQVNEEIDLGTHTVRVTTSLGIASSKQKNMSLNDLLKAADTAMYEAKIKGKNQYAISEHLIR